MPKSGNPNLAQKQPLHSLQPQLCLGKTCQFFFNLEAAFLENGNRVKKPSSLTPLWLQEVKSLLSRDDRFL